MPLDLLRLLPSQLIWILLSRILRSHCNSGIGRLDSFQLLVCSQILVHTLICVTPLHFVHHNRQSAQSIWLSSLNCGYLHQEILEHQTLLKLNGMGNDPSLRYLAAPNATQGHYSIDQFHSGTPVAARCPPSVRDGQLGNQLARHV